MSNSEELTSDVKRCSLPKFKDKVMYVMDSNGNEQSYTISSSFKGILRLSPNDLNSVQETKDIIELPEEFFEFKTNYSDAIVFDGDAALNSIASIQRRMIVASDSDSYAVDLRISDFGVEFDNLNVVGISKFKNLTLFSNDEEERRGSFKMGNNVMPTLHNSKSYKMNGIAYDVKKINVVKDGGDNSYILSGYSKNGNREFKFFRTKSFIEELVMEALLDLQTIPTGSIHFVPITMEQYKKLASGQKRPNVYSKDTDPIVRDFLLCDGRMYNSKDFPELAKMLWNENVSYWREVTFDGKTLLHKFEHKNQFEENKGEEKVNEEKVFRVPDLRRMFISSIYANGVDGYMDDASPIVNDYNYPGHWLPDNVPTSLDGDNDNHFHFIAYGTYSPIVSFPLPDSARDYKFVKGSVGSFTEVAIENEDKGGIMSSTTNPAILTLTNHLSWSHSPKEGPGFGTGTGGLRRRDYWGYEPWPAIAYMAGPKTTRKNIRNYSYAKPENGRTSLCFLNVKDAKDNKDAYGAINNTLKGETYADFDKDLYGHENTPKYVACLPLIKI